MLQQEMNYDQLASSGQLHQFAPHSRGEDHVRVIGNVTRADFKGLYTNQMVRTGKPARHFYDQLRVSVPNNRCPYCGIGAVETIDHFLPKGRYSSLSVLPLNLVPACRDCNTGKLDGITTAENISSHPYFEKQCVFLDEWLFASIIKSEIVHVTFHVEAPIVWPIEISRRVLNHFSEFDLSRRFSIQAAGRLTYYANLINGMLNGDASDALPTLLNLNIESELAAYGVNSWQVALAKAVAKDFWFCTTGYTQLL